MPLALRTQASAYPMGMFTFAFAYIITGFVYNNYPFLFYIDFIFFFPNQDKDILLRIKAQILGILSEDFTTDQVSDEYLQYTGRIDLYAEEAYFKEFKKKGISPNPVYQTDREGNIFYRKH